MLTEEQYDLIFEMIGRIYNQINWGKMKTSKNPWDIFNHRVRHASCKSNLYQFISTLCNFFGLQQANKITIEIADKLKECEGIILNTIYTEHIPICMKSILFAKKIKELNKIDKNQKNLFEDEEK